MTSFPDDCVMRTVMPKTGHNRPSGFGWAQTSKEVIDEKGKNGG